MRHRISRADFDIAVSILTGYDEPRQLSDIREINIRPDGVKVTKLRRDERGYYPIQADGRAAEVTYDIRVEP